MQVGHGLAEAHGAGIVHWDIKPANLFVTKSGTVKILHFSLANLAGSEGIKQTGTTVGDCVCMSPEQVRCEEARISGRWGWSSRRCWRASRRFRARIC